MKIRTKLDGTKFIIVTPDEPENPKIGDPAHYQEFIGVVTNVDPYGIRFSPMHMNPPANPVKDGYQPRITDVEIQLH